MAPTLLSHLRPLSAVASTVPSIDPAVRLGLAPVLNWRAAIDGAWWPYSHDAAAELPGLIAAVDRRPGRTTLRVGVRLDAWDHVPRRIPARGRQVKVGWFHCTDPRVITMVLTGAEAITLPVIPPGTAREPATMALTLAFTGATGLRPSDILTAAHDLAVTDGMAADETDPADGENDGGHPAALPAEGLAAL